MSITNILRYKDGADGSGNPADHPTTTTSANTKARGVVNDAKTLEALISETEKKLHRLRE